MLHRNFCQHRQWIPGCLWIAGSGLFTLEGGYNGAINHIISGVFDLSSEATAIIRGGKKYGYPIATALNTLSRTAWQLPYLADGNSAAWLGYGFLLLSNAPVMSEPWTQKKARAAVTHFHMTSTALTSTAANKARIAVLKIFANPRPFWAICHTASMVPWIAHDIATKNYTLMPMYFLWNSGNLVAALIRPDKKNTHEFEAVPRV